MFRKEDILIVKAGNASARGLQQALDQVASLYEEGYRLVKYNESDNYNRAKMLPWRIPMVKVGTKSIEELESETPQYVEARFKELPDNATKDQLNQFCAKYLLEVDESQKQPISRYQKTIRTILAKMIEESGGAVTESVPEDQEPKEEPETPPEE